MCSTDIERLTDPVKKGGYGCHMVELDMCALGAMDEHGIHIKKRTNMWMEEVAQCYVALSHSTRDGGLRLDSRRPKLHKKSPAEWHHKCSKHTGNSRQSSVQAFAPAAQRPGKGRRVAALPRHRRSPS